MAILVRLKKQARLWVCSSVLLALFQIAACGQKGPLILPEQAEQQKQ